MLARIRRQSFRCERISFWLFIDLGCSDGGESLPEISETHYGIFLERSVGRKAAETKLDLSVVNAAEVMANDFEY